MLQFIMFFCLQQSTVVELGLQLHRTLVIVWLLVSAASFAAKALDPLRYRSLWFSVSPVVSKQHFLCQGEVTSVE